MEPDHAEEIAQLDHVEEVEAEVFDGDLMISSASFEIDMSGIQADIAELTAAIDEALTVYGDMLVEPADIEAMDYSEARRRERAVSAAIREADELRRQLNRDYRLPLDAAKVRYDELMGPVIQLHAAYKSRRMWLDDQVKEQKKQAIAALYEAIAPRYALAGGGAERRDELDNVPELSGSPAQAGFLQSVQPYQPDHYAQGGQPEQYEPLVPFERIFGMFGGKWLNKSAGLDAIERELGGIVRAIAEGERRLSDAAPRHATEAWAVFWRTLDADAALARDRELCALEERQALLEQARAREQALREQAAATRATAEQGDGAPALTEQGNEAPGALDGSGGAPAVGNQGVGSADSSDHPIGVDAPVRKPRIMIIDGATDDECRQIAALCKSLGITGTFKGPHFHESVMALQEQGR